MIVLFGLLWMGLVGAMEAPNIASDKMFLIRPPEENKNIEDMLTAIIEYKEDSKVSKVERYAILPQSCFLLEESLELSLKNDCNKGIFTYAKHMLPSDPFVVAVEMYGIPLKNAPNVVSVLEQDSWSGYKKLDRKQIFIFEESAEVTPLSHLGRGFSCIYPASGDSLKIAITLKENDHKEFFVVQPYLSTHDSKRKLVRRLAISGYKAGSLEVLIKCNFIRNFHAKTTRPEPKEPLLDYILAKKN